MSSSTKVWIFILISSLFFLIIGYLIGDRIGLFISFILLLSFQYFIFLGYRPPLFNQYEMKELKGADPLRLNEFIDSFVQEHDFKIRPRIFMFHSQSMNSFAIKSPWKSGLISLSHNELEKCNITEIHSLLAYHIYFLNHSNHFINELILTIITSLQSFIYVMDSIFIKLFRTHHFPFFGFFIKPVTDFLMKLNYPKKLFYESDKFVIKCFKNEKEYAYLIWKIAGWNESVPLKEFPSTSSLFFIPPKKTIPSLFKLKLHPNTQQRLKNIVGYYPI